MISYFDHPQSALLIHQAYIAIVSDRKRPLTYPLANGDPTTFVISHLDSTSFLALSAAFLRPRGHFLTPSQPAASISSFPIMFLIYNNEIMKVNILRIKPISFLLLLIFTLLSSFSHLILMTLLPHHFTSFFSNEVIEIILSRIMPFT